MSTTELSLPTLAIAEPLAAASRPLDFRLALGLPLAAMAFLLLFDPSRLDFAISRWFYVPGDGFIGRHYGSFLENFLHDRAKQAVIVVGVLAIAGFLVSLLPTAFSRWRRVLGYVVLAMGLSTSLVNPLKTLTGMHCPWSLQEFGGKEIHTALLDDRAPPVVRAGSGTLTFTSTMAGPTFWNTSPAVLLADGALWSALVEAVNKALDETMLYRGRNVKTRNTIQMECHRIANGLIRPGEEPNSEDWDELVDVDDLKEERGCQ